MGPEPCKREAPRALVIHTTGTLPSLVPRTGSAFHRQSRSGLVQLNDARFAIPGTAPFQTRWVALGQQDADRTQLWYDVSTNRLTGSDTDEVLWAGLAVIAVVLLHRGVKLRGRLVCGTALVGWR